MTEQQAVRDAERAFLDAIKGVIQAEYEARQGLVTKTKQNAVNRASLHLEQVQRTLTTLYLNSIRGIDEAIEAVAEAPHDSAGEEWTDNG